MFCVPLTICRLIFYCGFSPCKCLSSCVCCFFVPSSASHGTDQTQEKSVSRNASPDNYDSFDEISKMVKLVRRVVIVLSKERPKVVTSRWVRKTKNVLLMSLQGMSVAFFLLSDSFQLSKGCFRSNFFFSTSGNVFYRRVPECKFYKLFFSKMNEKNIRFSKMSNSLHVSNRQFHSI